MRDQLYIRSTVMRAVEGGSRHTPPLREGVMRSASVGRRHRRQARPRSAVTVSPTAPGLSPLTGFSRSGLSEPVVAPLGIPSESPLRSPERPSLGLGACATVSLEARGIALQSAPVGPAFDGGLFMSSVPGGPLE